MIHQGIATDNGQCLGVSTETVLEQKGELGFSERDIFGTFLKTFNDVRQNTQRRVDILGLFQKSTLLELA